MSKKERLALEIERDSLCFQYSGLVRKGAANWELMEKIAVRLGEIWKLLNKEK